MIFSTKPDSIVVEVESEQGQALTDRFT